MNFPKAALWLFSPQVIFISLPYMWAVLGTKDSFNKWMTFTHVSVQTQRPVAALSLFSPAIIHFLPLLFSLLTKSPSSNTFSTLAAFLKSPAIAVIYSTFLESLQSWENSSITSSGLHSGHYIQPKKQKEKKHNQAIGANINIWSSTLAGPSVLTNSTRSTVSPILHRNGFKPFPLA